MYFFKSSRSKVKFSLFCMLLIWYSWIYEKWKSASTIVNFQIFKLTHILLRPIRCNLQNNGLIRKNVTYVSMATKTPIIKYREFFHISMFYISAINEHIASKFTPVMHGNVLNSQQKSSDLEMSRSRSNQSKTMKITVWAITFEPEVVDTSGWLHDVPYRMYDVTFLRHVTLKISNILKKNIFLKSSKVKLKGKVK